MASAVSNNTAKQILNVFDYPVTLTYVQFGFVWSWCLILALVQLVRSNSSFALFGAKRGIRLPTIAILSKTLPLSLFQITTHVFGSLATSEIPVSVVHTVKVFCPSIELTQRP